MPDHLSFLGSSTIGLAGINQVAACNQLCLLPPEMEALRLLQVDFDQVSALLASIGQLEDSRNCRLQQRCLPRSVNCRHNSTISDGAPVALNSICLGGPC